MIDWKKYTECLTMDADHLERVFQFSGVIASRFRAKSSLSFEQAVRGFSKKHGFQYSLDCPSIDGLIGIATKTNNGKPLVIVRSLDNTIYDRMSYFHVLAHVLMHRSVPSHEFDRENIRYESEAWLFAMVVTASCYDCCMEEFRSYLESMPDRLQTRYKSLFQDVLAFFEENWTSLASPTELLDSRATPLLLTVGDILMRKIADSPSLIYTISPVAFEDLMTEVFFGLGYAVEKTSRTRDGGIDIIAIKSMDDIPLRFLIECKRYAKERKVGVGIVRSVFGIKHHIGASKVIIATTSSYTKPAVEFASAHKWDLDLKERNDILQWIRMCLHSGN